MTNPLYSIERFPTTSQAAMREFLENYIAVLGGSEPSGLSAFGDLIPSRQGGFATFPVTQIGTKFQRWMGEHHFKTMQAKSFDLKTSWFEAGYEAPWYNLQKDPFTYRQWQAAPGQLVDEEGNFRDEAIAALLEAGTSTVGYPDGGNFFRTTHPANIFDSTMGTWSNYNSSGSTVLSIGNLETEISAMRVGVKDHLGRKMRIRPDTVIVAEDVAEPLENLLKQAMVYDWRNASTDPSRGALANNPYTGLKVFASRELSDTNDWYLLDSKFAKVAPPWISLREDLPPAIATTQWDESSEYFRNTKNIKFGVMISYGFGLAFPHAIRKIAVAP